jgi:hypothetical protein
MELVHIWTDVGSRKPVPLLAKIEEKDGIIYTIRYLTKDLDGIWRYEEDTYDIDEDSIAKRLKTANEEDIGFRRHADGFIKIEIDDDYSPSSEAESSSYSDDEDEDEDEDDPDDLEEDEEEDEEEFLDEEQE